MGSITQPLSTRRSRSLVGILASAELMTPTSVGAAAPASPSSPGRCAAARCVRYPCDITSVSFRLARPQPAGCGVELAEATPAAAQAAPRNLAVSSSAAVGMLLSSEFSPRGRAVSYTHLTLPT